MILNKYSAIALLLTFFITSCSSTSTDEPNGNNNSTDSTYTYEGTASILFEGDTGPVASIRHFAIYDTTNQTLKLTAESNDGSRVGLQITAPLMTGAVYTDASVLSIVKNAIKTYLHEQDSFVLHITSFDPTTRKLSAWYRFQTERGGTSIDTASFQSLVVEYIPEGFGPASISVDGKPSMKVNTIITNYSLSFHVFTLGLMRGETWDWDGEELLFSFPPRYPGKGSYSLGDNKDMFRNSYVSYQTYFRDSTGNAMKTFYSQTAVPGNLTITRFDTVKRYISGTFDVPVYDKWSGQTKQVTGAFNDVRWEEQLD